mgnify:CR=1 FL=1
MRPVTGFIDTHYGPLDRWEREAARIRSEPDQLLDACRRDVAATGDLDRRFGAQAAQITEAETKLAGIDKRLRELEIEQRPIRLCPTP